MKKILIFLVVPIFSGCFLIKKEPLPTGLEGYDPAPGVIVKEVGEDIYLRHVPLYIGGVPKMVDPETVKENMYIFHDQNFWGVPVVSPPPPEDKLEMVKENGIVWWKIAKATLMKRIIPSKRPALNSGELVEGRYFTYGAWQKTNGNRYIYWAEYTFSASDPWVFFNPDGSASLLLK